MLEGVVPEDVGQVQERAAALEGLRVKDADDIVLAHLGDGVAIQLGALKGVGRGGPREDCVERLAYE